jgi:hypothetical protein
MTIRHKVQEGECLSSIAFAHGFDPEALWNHPDNAALKAERESLHVLQPGDEVVIPERRPKTVSCATGRRHVFRRKGVPERFRLRLVRDGKPRPGLDYKLEIDDAVHTGKTDDEGRLEHWIPPNARKGRLVLGDGEEEYELSLGQLYPAAGVQGVRSRLEHLRCIPPGAEDDQLRFAVERFQIDHGLQVTGEVDEATGAKIDEEYQRFCRVDEP